MSGWKIRASVSIGSPRSTRCKMLCVAVPRLAPSSIAAITSAFLRTSRIVSTSSIGTDCSRAHRSGRCAIAHATRSLDQIPSP